MQIQRPGQGRTFLTSGGSIFRRELFWLREKGEIHLDAESGGSWGEVQTIKNL